MSTRNAEGLADSKEKNPGGGAAEALSISVNTLENANARQK